VANGLVDRLKRLTFHLPGYALGVQRALARPGEISLEEGRFLGDLVQRAPQDRPIIEIGTLFGASTRVLATFKRPETSLITVDSFRWNPHGLSRRMHEQVTREALRDAIEKSNVQLIQADKTQFYSAYKGPPPGLVFLDANHSYRSTLEDLKWAIAAGAAIVCGHDYKEKFPGVIRAVDELGGPAELIGSLYVLSVTT
jgi:predicted O-methyltransferase YrrM